MKVTFENVKKHLKKHWILMWLVCSLIAVGAFVVYASYTGVNSAKRVVSTRSASTVMFSSNILKSTATFQRLSSAVYTITICNYDQDNTTDVNPSDITYTINAYLAIKTGNNTYTKLSDYTGADKSDYISKLTGRSYSVQMIQDDANSSYTGAIINLVNETNYSTTITTNCSLKGEEKSTDLFRVSFDSKEMEDTEPEFYIYIEADPSAPATLRKIYNVLGAAKSTADAASWKGKLLETNCEDVDYDFYNYILNGSGVGTVDIMWDPSKFELNEFFFSDLSENEFVLFDSNGDVTTNTTGAKTKTFSDSKHTNWQMATLIVDSTDTNRYQIQLYKVNGELSYTGANKASDFIDCEYHKPTNDDS